MRADRVADDFDAPITLTASELVDVVLDRGVGDRLVRLTAGFLEEMGKPLAKPIHPLGIVADVLWDGYVREDCLPVLPLIPD